MQTIDLTRDWWLEDDGQDVLITGPGNLEIALRHFTATKLLHQEGLGPDVIGTLRQLSWRYPVQTQAEGDFEEVWLELITTWDSDQADSPQQHVLHAGNHHITWHLPDDVGQRLQGWFARKEEGEHG